MDVLEAINSRIACRQFTDEPVDLALDLDCQLAEPRLAQQRQVPRGRRQQHRPRDRGRGLGLDVELGHVLLGEHLVA